MISGNAEFLDFLRCFDIPQAKKIEAIPKIATYCDLP